MTAAVLRLDASLDTLAEVRRFVRERAPGLGADADATADLVQAVDEWVTNVALHGYGGHGPVEVELGRDGPVVVARVRDEAPAFDPSTARPFDPSLPLEDRPFGGMGIHLMRELMDEVAFAALPGGGNEVTMRRSGASRSTGGTA